MSIEFHRCSVSEKDEEGFNECELSLVVVKRHNRYVRRTPAWTTAFATSMHHLATLPLDVYVCKVLPVNFVSCQRSRLVFVPRVLVGSTEVVCPRRIHRTIASVWMVSWGVSPAVRVNSFSLVDADEEEVFWFKVPSFHVRILPAAICLPV